MAKTIKIIIAGGMVQDLKGLPKGWSYYRDNRDRQEPMTRTELEFKRKMYREKNTVVVIEKGGVVVDVKKLPSGYKYQIDDRD